MTIDLDYRNPLRPFPWAGAVLLVLGVAALAAAAMHYREAMARADYWEAKAGQAARSTARPMPVSQRELADMALEIRHANEVLGQITLPWDSLFNAVEWSAGKDIALLTIEPDAEKHQVKIRGEAKTIDAMLGYVRHLSAQDAFSSVYLQSHQVQRRERENPVRFALVASWKMAP